MLKTQIVPSPRMQRRTLPDATPETFRFITVGAGCDPALAIGVGYAFYVVTHVHPKGIALHPFRFASVAQPEACYASPPVGVEYASYVVRYVHPKGIALACNLFVRNLC